MKIGNRKLLLCNCEDTMALDPKALKKAFNSALGTSQAPDIHSHLCRAETAIFQSALDDGEPVRAQ